MSSLHPKYPLVFSPIKLGPIDIPKSDFTLGRTAIPSSFGNRPAQDFARYQYAGTRPRVGVAAWLSIV